jgi:hypothetical protein
MKSKSLLIAGAFSLGVITQLQAQTRIHITGSTAFRIAAYDGISASFDASPVVQIAAYSANAALDPHSASFMTFDGNIGGAHYIVKCHWSGSEAGIKDAATGATESFTQDIGSGGVTAGTFNTAPPATTSTNVDEAFSDTSQAVSFTRTPVVGTDNEIGVIPFKWVKNAQNGVPADWARLTNVSDAQMRVAFSGGTKLALLTGNSNDTKFVYICGRDNQSGTRANVLASTRYGVKTFVDQISITGPNGAPVNNDLGNGGQSSGGTVAAMMDITGSATNLDTIQTALAGTNVTGWYAVSYLGVPDANTAIAGGAVELTLDGVAESAATIQEGEYNYWGVEHIVTNPSLGLGSPQVAFASSLAARFTGPSSPLDGIIGINLSTMHASKASDLADPTHN